MVLSLFNIVRWIVLEIPNTTIWIVLDLHEFHNYDAGYKKNFQLSVFVQLIWLACTEYVLSCTNIVLSLYQKKKV